MVKYLTPEGLAKLKRELYDLKTIKRKEIAARLKHAASFGDLSENAAYHEAKEAQGFLEGRIKELSKIISQSKIIQNKDSDRVQLGSTVLLFSSNKKQEFQIVNPEEADIFHGKISNQSPLGKTLLGKSKGDKIRIENSQGKTEYEIIEIK